MKKIIKNFNNFINETRESFDIVYHGTSNDSAINIQKNGIDITKCHGGYFGWGFYTTPDIKLAKSNYADFSDDENDGSILEFKISKRANILDLRDEDDFETWKKYSNKLSDRNLYELLIRDGIDGLYDNSFEGIVVYNFKILTLLKIYK